MKINDPGISCGIVYHYTTLGAALSIITKDGLKFHASRYDCMDDAYDSEYGFAAAEKTLGEHYCYDNTFCTPYVLSFCKKEDDLSMQRMYNAEVVLHIDSDLLLLDAVRKSDKVRGDEIKYMSEKETANEVEDAHLDCICAAPDLELREYNAAAKSSFYKHEQYSIEDEWRLSYFQDFNITNWDRPKCLNGDDLSSDVRFKPVNGKIRMYRELTFDKKCLKGITIFEHSLSNCLRVWGTIEAWLAKCGYKHDELELKRTKTPMVNK